MDCFRHALTCGHCVCSRDEDTDSGAKCVGSDSNEITPYNKIEVFAGSRSITISKEKFRTHVIKAWVIPSSFGQSGFLNDYDVGMVQTKRDKPFFTGEYWLKRYIAPICIPALEEDFSEKDIKGVGWGHRYTESPQADIQSDRNPAWSSCLANEIGPSLWKFRQCDMAQIKENGWSCDKKGYPPNYNAANCKVYFDLARTAAQEFGDVVVQEVQSVQKINVVFGKVNKTVGSKGIMCYRDEHFKHVGWCKVPEWASGIAHEGGWGFCSPSCENSIIGVNTI